MIEIVSAKKLVRWYLHFLKKELRETAVKLRSYNFVILWKCFVSHDNWQRPLPTANSPSNGYRPFAAANGRCRMGGSSHIGFVDIVLYTFAASATVL